MMKKKRFASATFPLCLFIGRIQRHYILKFFKLYSIPENGDLHNLKIVVSAEHEVDCLTVFDHSRQPYGQNHCANNNCCGLCLPTRKT
jgi:hypothetical protein